VPAAETSATLAPDPRDEPTSRERTAALLEERLDVPMAVLAVVWAALVAYELVAPARHRDELGLVGNVIWGVFAVEFVAKLWVSGHPARFLRRRWPSLVFLLLPAFRILRVVRAVRALRVLPAARVVGSSYRAIGTARALLGSRLVFLGVASLVVVFSGGQLLYLVEGDAQDGTLGDALWWAANLALSSSLTFQPATALGRILAVVLSVYAIVVFASVAGTVGAFFIESRAERATEEEGPP
jgi:voltage-gated potassium channel